MLSFVVKAAMVSILASQNQTNIKQVRQHGSVYRELELQCVCVCVCVCVCARVCVNFPVYSSGLTTLQSCPGIYNVRKIIRPISSQPLFSLCSGEY